MKCFPADELCNRTELGWIRGVRRRIGGGARKNMKSRSTRPAGTAKCKVDVVHRIS